MAWIFLIHPVRGKDPETYRSYVEGLEAEGHQVYWPARDTNQNDPTGLDICNANHAAITVADEIHLIWDGQSQGCLFDLGIVFSLDKKIHILSLPPATEGKSFQNMVRAYAEDWRLRHSEQPEGIARGSP